MKINRPIKTLFLIILFGIITPFIMASCDCDFLFNINTASKTVTTPVLFADTEAKMLQWYDVEETDVYEVYVNGVRHKTFSIDESQVDGIVEWNYANVLTNNAKNTFLVVGKNIDKEGFKDSDQSNEIIINTTYAFNTTSKSTYNFNYNKQIVPSAVRQNNELVITWDNIGGDCTYLIRSFSNNNGYVERIMGAKPSQQQVSYTLPNIGVNDIVTYNISIINSAETATVISAKNEYYKPANYTVIAFDGYLWDYYINSQDELNAVVYYNYLTRNPNYTITFDSNFISTSDAMHNAVTIAFDSFFETSYYNIMDENAPNYGKVNGQNYNVEINYYGVSQCDTSLKINENNILNDIDTGIQYYDNIDNRPSNYTARQSDYDNFVSDQYLLSQSVSKSEELYNSIENKITPIVTAGSRAELVYNMAKQVLREIIYEGMTDYEKALSIFDWITLNTRYDYNGSSVSGNYNFTQNCCYYLEGVFLKGIAVCDGFSKAYSMMCNMEGIDCIRIVGTATTGFGYGGHAWNKVKIDNEYYIVDITWTELIEGSTEYLSHKYFMLSEQSISSTHIPYENRDKFFMYPTKIETTLNYFKMGNYNYIDQDNIFFNDTSTLVNNNVIVEQYIDSSEDLQKAMYLPLLNNSRFVELAIDYDYLLELAEKYNKSNTELIYALQEEMKLVKYPAQLVSAIYDASGNYVNFIQYSKDKFAMICLFDTTLLVNEPKANQDNELADILEVFGKYANENPNVLYSTQGLNEYGYEIEIGFDLSYILEVLNKPYRTYENEEFKVLFNEFMNKFVKENDIYCEYTYEFTTLVESSKINNNTVPTRIHYVLFKIIKPWMETIAIPATSIQDNHILTWDAIEYASEYKVYVQGNSTPVATISAVAGKQTYTLDLNNILSQVGSYNVSVVAISNNINYGNSSPSTALTYIVLNKPSLQISGTSISWDWQNGVTSYKIFNNTSQLILSITKTDNEYVVRNSSDVVIDTLITNSIDLSNYITTPQTYSLSIVAVVNNGTQVNLTSENSSSVQYTQLAQPTNVKFSGTTLSWSYIADASKYIVKYCLDSSSTFLVAFETTNNSITQFDASTIRLAGDTKIAQGNYVFCVQAINTNTGYSNSSNSEIATYVKLDSPSISFSNSSNPFELKWTFVADSNSQYILYLNKFSQSTTLSNGSLDLSSIITDPGSYTVNLKHSPKSGVDGYEASEYSNDATFVQLKNPMGAINESILSWARIDMATQYLIYNGSSYVGEVQASTAISYQFDISTLQLNYGNYMFYIKAVRDNSIPSTTVYNSAMSEGVNYSLIEPGALSAPNIRLTNNTTLEWDAIQNASGYNVYNTSSSTPLTTLQAQTGTTTYSVNLSTYLTTTGNYQLFVIATSNSQNFVNSATSNTITYVVLSKPSLVLNTNTLQWSWQSGATYYKIIINNVTTYNIYKINNTTYQLKDSSNSLLDTLPTNAINLQDYLTIDGTYNIKIQAVVNNGTQINVQSEISKEITYILDLPEALSQPVVTDINFSNESITWDIVEYANSYNIYMDNSKVGSSTTNTYNFANHIYDYNVHNFAVEAVDTNNVYLKSPKSTAVSFERSNQSNAIILDNYTIYSNSVIDPEVVLTGSTLSWNAVPFVDGYLAIIQGDAMHKNGSTAIAPQTYFISLNKSTSYNLSNVYSDNNININEILAYKIVAIKDDQYYSTDLTTNYYNPNTSTAGTYADVYAFDGEFNDYYTTSQDEVNNLMYYMFITRMTAVTFKATSTICSDTFIDENSATRYTYIENGFNSFAETSYYEGSYWYNYNNTFTIQLNYVYGNTPNYNYFSTNESLVEAKTYEQYSIGLEYYNQYDYTGRERLDTYDEFASNKGIVRVEVSTSEELYWAIENKFVPICQTGSRAENIYNIAKRVLREIISDQMSEYEKILTIYDWITTNTKYDYYSFTKSNKNDAMTVPSYYLDGVFMNGFDSSGNFIRGIAVCDGFSKAFSLLCNMEGIDCIRIVGEASNTCVAGSYGGHAWNKVKLNGSYYFVDITWSDLVVIMDNTNTNEIHLHSHFLLSDSSTSQTHIPYAERTKFTKYATANNDYGYWNKTTYTYGSTTQDIYIQSDSELDKIVDVASANRMFAVEVYMPASYATTFGTTSSSIGEAINNKLSSMIDSTIVSSFSNIPDIFSQNGTGVGCIVVILFNYR